MLLSRAPMTLGKEIPAYSVADLARRLRRAVEMASADVWVVGEVSSAKPAPSGHVYFSLKDEREDAIIECVMYRSAPVRARMLIADGARIQLRGRATVWAPRGRLQFVGELARPAGRGALLEALEALKNKLFAEGLFHPDRKRPLPRHAAVIGVVTSAAGAAIHDIAKVAFRRGGVRIVLSPAQVQGQNAARQIITALDRLECVRDLEVIILGRGGGSSEDLMVFNDEAVVRRVAACQVPVVSAVGHEVDMTLTDLAADARAATPSQAAEMVVADSGAQQVALADLHRRLLRGMRARLLEDRAHVVTLVAGLGEYRQTIAQYQQRKDDLEERLEFALRRPLMRKKAEIERLHRRLASRHPRAVIATSRGQLGPLEVRLERAQTKVLDGARARLAQRLGRLHAMSPLAVLSRGYAIATDASGRALRDAREAFVGQKIALRLHQGVLAATIDGVDSVHGGDARKAAATSTVASVEPSFRGDSNVRMPEEHS